MIVDGGLLKQKLMKADLMNMSMDNILSLVESCSAQARIEAAIRTFQELDPAKPLGLGPGAGHSHKVGSHSNRIHRCEKQFPRIERRLLALEAHTGVRAGEKADEEDLKNNA